MLLVLMHDLLQLIFAVLSLQLVSQFERDATVVVNVQGVPKIEKWKRKKILY